MRERDKEKEREREERGEREKERVSIERRQTPSRYTRESVSLLDDMS